MRMIPQDAFNVTLGTSPDFDASRSRISQSIRSRAAREKVPKPLIAKKKMTGMKPNQRNGNPLKKYHSLTAFITRSIERSMKWHLPQPL